MVPFLCLCPLNIFPIKLISRRANVLLGPQWGVVLILMTHSDGGGDGCGDDLGSFGIN